MSSSCPFNNESCFLCTLGCFLCAFFGFLTISKTDDVITANSVSLLTAKSKCSPRDRLPASGEFCSNRYITALLSYDPDAFQALIIGNNLESSDHLAKTAGKLPYCRQKKHHYLHPFTPTAAPTTNVPTIFCGLIKSMNN